MNVLIYIEIVLAIGGCRTKIMATDAIALLDHLGWKRAHVCGHSMGKLVLHSLVSISSCWVGLPAKGFVKLSIDQICSVYVW